MSSGAFSLKKGSTIDDFTLMTRILDGVEECLLTICPYAGFLATCSLATSLSATACSITCLGGKKLKL